jgi:uncharacterized membrane protein YhaH (DUF805 family)
MLAFFFRPSGRIGRAQWWLAQIAVIALVTVVLVVLGILHGASDQTRAPDAQLSDVGLLILLNLGFLLISLLLIWMTFCLTVKRYHDRGKSAWWYLIQFIPIIGGIWTLVELGFCSGDDGDNEYGDGPDLNIGDELKALREMGGQPSPVATAATYRPTPTPRTSGPPVFGKRG